MRSLLESLICLCPPFLLLSWLFSVPCLLHHRMMIDVGSRCRGLRPGWAIVSVLPLGLLQLFPSGHRFILEFSCGGTVLQSSVLEEARTPVVRLRFSLGFVLLRQASAVLSSPTGAAFSVRYSWSGRNGSKQVCAARADVSGELNARRADAGDGVHCQWAGCGLVAVGGHAASGAG